MPSYFEHLLKQSGVTQEEIKSLQITDELPFETVYRDKVLPAMRELQLLIPEANLAETDEPTMWNTFTQDSFEAMMHGAKVLSGSKERVETLRSVLQHIVDLEHTLFEAFDASSDKLFQTVADLALNSTSPEGSQLYLELSSKVIEILTAARTDISMTISYLKGVVAGLVFSSSN